MTPTVESEQLTEVDCPPVQLSPAHQRQPREWFAVHCMPNHERQIARHLTVRELEHFCPFYTAMRRRFGGLQVLVDLPLFPTYLFTRIARTQRVCVLEVPGVLSIVGGRHPCPVPDGEIDW